MKISSIIITILFLFYPVKATSPLPPPEILPEGTYTLNIENEFISKEFFRKLYLPLDIVYCNNCSTREIEEILPLEGKNWVGIKDGNIIYTHSGGIAIKGSFLLGDFLRVITYQSSFDNTSISFGNDQLSKTFEVIDSKETVIPKKGITVKEIFPQYKTGDLILVTCKTFNPNSSNNIKILLLLREKQ